MGKEPFEKSKSHDAQQKEVDRNYAVFRKKLPELLMSNRGGYALMRDGEIVVILDTLKDARKWGEAHYSGQPYSIQEITDQIVDLGIYSRALHLG